MCWGYNHRGQASAPPGRFTEISAGGFHTCALREDGGAVCWGYNDHGQATSPPGRFTKISAGGFHTCALRHDGGAVCWGYDDDGQSSVPENHSFFKDISAGFLHACGLLENGDAVCWGDNNKGQAEDVLGEGFVAISAGGRHTCALRNDGTGNCWGGGGVVPLDGPFTAISAGHEHTCALREDGEAACWGNGDRGQASPPSVRFTEIAAGYKHSCGLRGDGEAVCWGKNEQGESLPPRDRFAASRVRAAPAYDSFDAATLLARSSTDDALEGEARAAAASEILAQYKSGEADTARVLDLLHTVAPDLSIDERRRAADELARISEDDEWDAEDAATAAFYLGSVITGGEPNPEERVEAANEMVLLRHSRDGGNPSLSRVPPPSPSAAGRAFRLPAGSC